MNVLGHVQIQRNVALRNVVLVVPAQEVKQVLVNFLINIIMSCFDFYGAVKRKVLRVETY